MFTDFIITFRETLEAALIAGIILSYLAKIGQKDWFKTVYAAIVTGIVLSIGIGVIIYQTIGTLEGATEEIAEGILMITAAALITWMIVWMMKQKNRISQNLRNKVDSHIQTERKTGIFLLITVAILREGTETVLFLQASAIQNGGNSILASIIGITLAATLGYVLFTGLKKVPLSQFFNITSVLLILFAAGLLAHGIHELQEAGWIPYIIQEVWNLNPEQLANNTYHPLHEKGLIGSFLKGLLGYNGNPSLIEVISYFTYLLTVSLIAIKFSKPKTLQQ
jgi:high-affinity iron transporter